MPTPEWDIHRREGALTPRPVEPVPAEAASGAQAHRTPPWSKALTVGTGRAKDDQQAHVASYRTNKKGQGGGESCV